MSRAEQANTPLMEQYFSIKDEYEDAILLFRLGDFYEVFFDDAEITSRILEITLTSKPVGKDNEVPMAGIPVHSVNSYVDQLIDEGYRVAICEQVEDADASSGVVDREV
ncbi:MAG: DNA mismatch repair protein MutS, partial [bacterium]